MVKLKLIKEKDGQPLPKNKWHFIELEKGSKEEGSFYMDGILKSNLEKTKKIIRNDWDFLYIIDGIEGGGKSVFAQQLAFFVSDGDFDVNEITYSPKDFKKQVLKSQKYNAIVFDEAFRGMSARAAMTQTNRMLMGLLQEIRQKNLYVFIVLPSIWDLDKYVAIHRCAGLFHIDVDSNRQRGFFKFYNKSQLTNLLRDYKLKYKYPFSPKFKGRFTNYYPLDKEAYLKKKDEALGHYGYDNDNEVEKESLKIKKLREEMNVYIARCKKYGDTDEDLEKLAGFQKGTLTNRRYRSKLKKIALENEENSLNSPPMGGIDLKKERVVEHSNEDLTKQP